MNLSDRLFYGSIFGDLCIDGDQSLGGLYQAFPEEAAAVNRLREALCRAGLPDGDAQEDIFRVYWDICTLYEKQGFLNGLRFGANLTRELLL